MTGTSRIVRQRLSTCTSATSRHISSTNPKFPGTRGLAGTITQSRSALAIQPPDCGPPATALADMARAMACAAKPKATVAARTAASRRHGRSEEHTSELQSQVNLVCRLLLEKKKKKNITHSNAKKPKEKKIIKEHTQPT